MNLSTFNSKDPKRARQFIFGSFALLFAALTLHFVICEVFTRKVIYPNIVNELDHLKRGGKNFRMVALGTSHTMALRLEGPRVFNFGYSRTYPTIMYFKMKHLQRVAPQVEAVLLEADSHLFYSWAARCDKYRHSLYIDETVDPSLGNHPQGSEGEFYSLKEEISPTIYKKMAIELYKRFARGAAYEVEKEEEMIRWSSYPLEYREKKAISTLIHLSLYTYESMNPLLKDYYEKTIKMALIGGAKIFFVRFPMAKEFLEHHNPEIEQDVSMYLLQLSDRYKIQTLDYRRIFDNQQELFHNSNHCNSEGQRVLTRRVFEDLRKFSTQDSFVDTGMSHLLPFEANPPTDFY